MNSLHDLDSHPISEGDPTTLRGVHSGDFTSHRTGSGVRSALSAYSVCCVYYLTFLGNMSFSIVLPSLWPYLTENGKHYQFGLYLGPALTVFSAGQMLAAPLFDLWMDMRETREVLCVSMAFLVVGSVLYVLLPASYTLFGILISRLLVGVAAANYNVTHSYLTFGVRASERMRVLSLQKLWSVLGFIAGPVVSLLVSFGGWNDDSQAETAMFNDWTMPGYILGTLGLFGFIFVLFMDEAATRKRISKDLDSFRDYLSLRLGQSFPDTPSSLCIFLYAVLTAAITAIETIAIPFAYDHFLGSIYVTKVSACLFFVLIGVFCGISLFGLRVARLCTDVNDRQLMVISFACLVVGFALMLHPKTTLAEFGVGAGAVVVGYSLGISSVVAVFYVILHPAGRVFLSNWVSTGAAVSRILVPLLVTFLYYPLGYQPGGDPQHPSSFILFVVIESLMVFSFIVSLLLCIRTSNVFPHPDPAPRGEWTMERTVNVVQEALCISDKQ